MKITRIETFILGTGSAKDLLFCRVETEDGLYGWGEAYVTQGKEKVVAECIQHSPYRAGDVRRFRDQARLARAIGSVECR